MYAMTVGGGANHWRQRHIQHRVIARPKAVAIQFRR